MDFNKVQKIYFLGIGGIGMSALARYFQWMGKDVSGYDRTPTDLTRQLQNEGMQISFTDSAHNLQDGIDLVIFTPAIPKDSILYNHFFTSGLPMFKRAQILGMISSAHRTIAVAGTHGKTSVTSMIAHIFKKSEKGFMAFLGGITTNYETNFLIHGQPEWCIVEADEYDRSFLNLSPEIAVITSMDADHLDIYGTAQSLEESFKLFAGRVSGNGTLITHNSVEKLKDIHPHQQYYKLKGPGSFWADDIKVVNGRLQGTFKHRMDECRIVFGWAGIHNLENALAATAAARNAGIGWDSISSALSSFTGVKRRFELILKKDDLIYIDDYAHHPEELKTCIISAREMYPGRKITGIFQPHLFTRTRDFADGFASSLDLLDEAVLMDIYPARELPIPGVTSAIIFNQMKLQNRFYLSDSQITRFVENGEFEVILTLGAGNIDTYVLPIKMILQK